MLDSQSFKRFGDKYLSTPGPKSGIEERKFYDLRKEAVTDRIAEKPKFKTLTGIKSVFQYICKTTGEFLWRKLPCYCERCSNLDWEHCENSDIVGKFKIVIKPGADF